MKSPKFVVATRQQNHADLACPVFTPPPTVTKE